MKSVDSFTVLLEGASDVRAVEALAKRAGVDLARVELVDLGGVTNAGKALSRLFEHSAETQVAGLCDANEAGVIVRALRRVGLPARDETDLPSYGFFVCRVDLEDELIRALGTARAVGVIERLGLGAKFQALRGQEAWRDRPLAHQLHRFCGVASGRKELLAGAFAAELQPGEAPPPLRDLIDRLPRSSQGLDQLDHPGVSTSSTSHGSRQARPAKGLDQFDQPQVSTSQVRFPSDARPS